MIGFDGAHREGTTEASVLLILALIETYSEGNCLFHRKPQMLTTYYFSLDGINHTIVRVYLMGLPLSVSTWVRYVSEGP